jgi:hypothetical protein
MPRFLLMLLVLLSLGLVACDDSEDDDSDANGDAAPLAADAGEDFTVTVGEAPVFDACESSGDIDNYAWTIITAPASVPEDEGKVIREIEPNCSFTLEDPMAVQEVGEWVIELEVQSGDETATDTVTVSVVAPTEAVEETEEPTDETDNAASENGAGDAAE